MKDGRSQPPPLPHEFLWIQWAVIINRCLGSCYRVEDLMQMPGDQLELLMAWCENAR